MHILLAQTVSLICLYLGMVGAFLLPFWFISPKLSTMQPKYRIAINLANCVSGGVFLATFFVGLMPEVRILYQHVFKLYEISYSFPLTEFVIFIGFLLALAVEQSIMEHREKKMETLIISQNDKDASNSPEDNSIALSSSDHSHGHCHQDLATAIVGSNGSGVRLGMLLVSLGVHSIFEGLALGLQTSTVRLFQLAVGVAMHEILMSFALGVSVSRHLSTMSAVKLAFLFSATIPVGQVFGILIGHYQSKATLAISATLQGLAAGTFIHVTFMEIIPTEFSEKGFRLLRVFALGLGFMFLVLCTVLMENFEHFPKWE